jgi:hypothetical protein
MVPAESSRLLSASRNSFDQPQYIDEAMPSRRYEVNRSRSVGEKRCSSPNWWRLAGAGIPTNEKVEARKWSALKPASLRRRAHPIYDPSRSRGELILKPAALSAQSSALA